MLKLKEKDHQSYLMQVHAPNTVSEYQAFVDDVNDAFQRVGSTESVTLMGNFNSYIGTNHETWQDMIGKHGDPVFNKNGWYLLQLCCSNKLCIINTFFQYQYVHKCTWYRPSMAQKSFALLSQICFQKC